MVAIASITRLDMELRIARIVITAPGVSTVISTLSGTKVLMIQKAQMIIKHSSISGGVDLVVDFNDGYVWFFY